MNEILFPETSKYAIVQQVKEGMDSFICFKVDPQNQFSSGSPIVAVFDSEEEAKSVFPQAFGLEN